MNWRVIKENLQDWSNSSYKDFIMGLIAFEFSIDDEEQLEHMYENFISGTDSSLLNSSLATSADNFYNGIKDVY